MRVTVLFKNLWAYICMLFANLMLHWAQKLVKTRYYLNLSSPLQSYLHLPFYPL